MTTMVILLALLAVTLMTYELTCRIGSREERRADGLSQPHDARRKR